MPIPSGWTQRVTNPNEYEAILIKGQYKYEVNVNVQTGQRQIYTIDPIFQTRTFVGTINANGSIVKQPAWNNIDALPNGQTRLKDIIDTSRVAANTIVKEVGTPQSINNLQNQKEFKSLKSREAAPTDPTKSKAGAAASGPEAQSSGSEGTNVAADSIPDSESLTKDQKEQYGNLYYPEDVGKDQNQDHVSISMYRYKNADFLGLGANQADPTKILSGALSTFQDTAQRTLLGSVTLPMVNNLSETNQTGWGSDNLSSIAASLMAGGTSVIEKAVSGDLFGAGGTLTDLGKEVLGNAGVSGRLQTYLTTKAAAGIIGKIGLQINPEAYITRATGTIPNPNLELLFNGPKLRSFELAFKLSPRSQKEAVQVRKIIKFFKKGMAPRRSLQSEQSFFLGTPNVFKVQFKSGNKELRSLVTYKTCALVTCQVNYTPDGFYAAYNDAAANGSQPIAVTLQLGFAELTPVYNDQYDLDDSVGLSENVSSFQYEKIGTKKEPAKVTAPGPSRGGTSAVVAPVVPVTGGRNPTSIPGDPGYRPPSPGGGLLEGAD